MKIQTIRVQNYGAFYGQHAFALSDRGLVIVLGDNRDGLRMDSNGSGKSTLFDALDWCLFGVVPRGDHVDSIINEEAGKDCSVEVLIQDDSGVPLTVRRFRKVGGKSGSAVQYGNADQTALDSDETDRIIQRHLGMDREVFHAAVLFAQTDLQHFADSGNAEQMEILTKALQMGQVDTWGERAKELLKKAEVLAQQQEQDAARIAGELEGLRRIDFAAQSVAWEQDHQRRWREAQEQVTAAKAQVATLRERVRDPGALQQQLTALQASVPQLPAQAAQAQVEIQKAQQAQAQAQAQGRVQRSQASQQRSKASLFQQRQGAVCSECGQVVSGDHVAREVAKLLDEAVKADALAAEADDLARRWSEHQASLAAALASMQQQFDEQRREHTARVATMQAELGSVVREAQTLQTAQIGLVNLETTLAGVMAEKNPFDAKQVELRHRIADAEQAEHYAKRGAADAREEVRYLAFWVEGFGPKGLKNYILDTKLQAITDATNHWVRLLTGGTIWVRLETQTMGRSTGTLRNKLNIRVFCYLPDGTIRERNYKSWSGGEKQRVSLGIDLGLSSLVAARAQKRYDVLILDELFKHLDAAGREAVMDMLRALRREKSSVFVVDHDADFKAQFEHQVTVRKQGGRSALVEVQSDYRSGNNAEAQSAGTIQCGAVPPRQSVPRRRTPVRAPRRD